MRFLALLLLLIAVPSLAQAPNGTNTAPFAMKNAQSANASGGQVSCTGGSTTLLASATFIGCRSVVFKNISADGVHICPGLATCATSTAGVYLEQYGSITIDRSLLQTNPITCISAGSSSTVKYYLECG